MVRKLVRSMIIEWLYFTSFTQIIMSLHTFTFHKCILTAAVAKANINLFSSWNTERG